MSPLLAMENDANCFAVGEAFCGAAVGCKDFIVLTLGTGIGSGMLSERQPGDRSSWNGRGGRAHFDIGAQGPEMRMRQYRTLMKRWHLQITLSVKRPGRACRVTSGPLADPG